MNFFKKWKITLLVVASISLISVAIYFKVNIYLPKSENSINVKNNNSNAIINQTTIDNHELSKSATDAIMKPYIDQIDDLEMKLKKSTLVSEKLQLTSLLNITKNKLKEQITQTEELKKIIKTSTIRVVKDATKILNEQGVKKALKFLQSKGVKEREKKLQKDMKEFSQKYILEAKLNIIQHNYKKTDDNYQIALKYNRSNKNLSSYAYFLQKQKQIDKSILYYEETLKIRKDLAKQNPSAYNSDVANTLNSLALIYENNNQLKKAKKAYLEALKVQRGLAKQNPSAYNHHVAITLSNLANLYMNNYQLREAKETYLEALEIKRVLAKQNPSAYNSDVAMTLISLANLYLTNNQLKEAKKAYLEALKIKKDLAKQNPNTYSSSVADTLNNLAILYLTNNQLEEAKKACLEALDLYRDLAKQNPSTYNFNVADTLNNLVILFLTNDQPEEAEKAYLEALSLYKDLAKQNPSVYGIDYANTIVLGIDLLKKPKSNLKEVKKYLLMFEDNFRAEELLQIIRELEDNNEI
jgi:tetratricopeptide (TPR) repeat protein